MKVLPVTATSNVSREHGDTQKEEEEKDFHRHASPDTRRQFSTKEGEIQISVCIHSLISR